MAALTPFPGFFFFFFTSTRRLLNWILNSCLLLTKESVSGLINLQQGGGGAPMLVPGCLFWMERNLRAGLSTVLSELTQLTRSVSLWTANKLLWLTVLCSCDFGTKEHRPTPEVHIAERRRARDSVKKWSPSDDRVEPPHGCIKWAETSRFLSELQLLMLPEQLESNSRAFPVASRGILNYYYYYYNYNWPNSNVSVNRRKFNKYLQSKELWSQFEMYNLSDRRVPSTGLAG